ncbi:hypothetical protein SO694_00001555 [Aureococcus anophagefferens]|uniref:RING-type domain-containing protein n=1 Tax=Aureococcus anophagefferens TaxID=44056 RepID=A0ABR1GC14_AURAN
MFLLPVVALAAAASSEDDVYERVYSVQNLHDEADVLWLRSEAGSSSVGRVFDAVAKHDASRLQTRRAAAAGILPAYFFFGPRGAAKAAARPRVVVCNTRELRDSELCGGLVDESYWAALEAAFAEDRGAVDGDAYDADAALALACALGDRNHFPQAKVELRESLRGGADAARLALGRVMVVAAILDGGGRRPDFMADVRALVDDVDGTMAFGARVAARARARAAVGALDREIDALRSPKRGARDPPAQAAALLDEARRLLRDVRDARDPAPARGPLRRATPRRRTDPPGAASPATPARKAARSLEALAALRELDPRALPNDALEVVDGALPELTRKVAFSCGHLCVCACAADIAECPLCRSPVRTKRRIYFD